MKHPTFAWITLLLAVICFATWAIIPNYTYRQSAGTVYFENPESCSTSSEQWSAIVDNKEILYCLDNEDSLVYAIDIHQLPFENAEIVDVTFGANNHLYCHLAIYNDSAYLTDSEAIWEIDTKGNFVHEVLHYDYTKVANPPSHQTQIMGLHFNVDKLCYLYKEETGNHLIAMNPDNPQQRTCTTLPKDEFAEIRQCHGTPDKGYLILKNNGEIGSLSYDGTYETLYKATYDARSEEGIFPYDVLQTKDSIYMLAKCKEMSLYKWNQGDWEMLFPIKKAIGLSKDSDLYYYGLEAYNHTLALHANESIHTLTEDATLDATNQHISLPISIRISMWFKAYLPFIGTIFLLLGILSGIGNLMKWRLSILSKQLLTTIPLVCIMLTVVVAVMMISMINLSTEDILKETIAINEIAASQFDGEALSHITNYDAVDNGQVKELNDQLRHFVNGNQSDWSRNYNLALYVRTTAENFLCVANSDGSDDFLVNSISTEYPIHEEFYENSHTFAADVSYGGEQENLHLILVTPIYREDGSYDAIILLSASQNRLIEELVHAGKQLVFNIILWIALLILAITLVSAYNVQSLRKAKNVIAQIASGDFSVRIDKFSKDEVGEICVGVNDMADRLEEYFQEKNRNEQFYYKFVPEKFRELLHKQKFTDLALGDAQSADLSILFCDIRAFSMNSEMMTARESFDFVNRIYGVAGPIIRKHNGFVDKYIGDAVMALFESAEDAVNAGIELYQAIVLTEHAEDLFGLPSVKIGVGIHSGMARIGIVGEEERMSGTVIANTVNLSSRIESLTKRYGAGMIISKDTLDRMSNPDMLSTRYLGMVQVAGVNEVSALYEVLDCLPEATREKREETKTAFREAVRLFHMGELQQALECFQKLAKSDSDDKASTLYAEYIEDKIKQGDVEHNVFRFKNKQ